jgi:hypothetical protein
MNRLITALFVLLAACQTQTTDSQTNDVEQAATTGDCVPGGNYQYAKLPQLPLWTGATPPAAGPGQVYLDVADWRPNTQSTGIGFHVAVLTDPGTGQFLWGATVPDGKLASFRATGGARPRVGDCCFPPPCGCRTCCDQWLQSTWMARNFLEVSLRTVEDAQHGAAAAGPLYPPKL